MKREKPQKPYPEFPLFPHPNGCWSKKIRGKPHYFGPWVDPDAALRKYLDEKDDLFAGRIPRKSTDGFTVRHAINSFLAAKESQSKTGEIAGDSWDMYRTTCEILSVNINLARSVADLQPVDFAELRERLAKGVGLVTLGIRIRITRMVFKHAFDMELISTPVRFGPQFRGPTKQNLRIEKNAKPARMLEATEIRRILAKSSAPFSAMILLGVNCGFGQNDCATLPRAAVDLEYGWIEFPRPKTGMSRRAKLWPETIAAIHDVLALGRKATTRADAHLLFLTRHGRRYIRRYKDGGRRDAIGQRFNKIQELLKLKRKGVGFYTLRHVFETIGGDTQDQPAVDRVMGHTPSANDMGARYRERIDDSRLAKIAEHVRKWLFDDT